MRQNTGNDNWSDSIAIVPPIDTKYDATANDSDKSWTVPTNEMWKLNYAHVILATSADVGNRQLTMEISNAAGQILIDLTAGAVQAASTTVHYGFLQGIFRETSAVAGELQVPIPIDCYLGAGYTIRFYDESAIAAAADDMTVSFQYQKMAV